VRHRPRGHDDPTKHPHIALANARSRGFTLLQLLVVMAILGLLAGYIGPRCFSQVGKSEVKAARSPMDALAKALGHYRLDTGQYPSQEHDLGALTARPKNEKHWYGPYAQGPAQCP
jgi:general secretion pathway protein G